MYQQITWVDISSRPQPWLSLEEAKELRPCVCISLGKVVHEDDQVVVLAGSFGPPDSEDDPDVGMVTCIPKVCITRRRALSLSFEETP